MLSDSGARREAFLETVLTGVVQSFSMKAFSPVSLEPAVRGSAHHPSNRSVCWGPGPLSMTLRNALLPPLLIPKLV